MVKVKALYSCCIDLPDGRQLVVGKGQIMELSASNLVGSWQLFERLDCADDNDTSAIATAMITPKRNTAKRIKK